MAGGEGGNKEQASDGGKKTAIWIGIAAIAAFVILILVATSGGNGGGY